MIYFQRQPLPHEYTHKQSTRIVKPKPHDIPARIQIQIETAYAWYHQQSGEVSLAHKKKAMHFHVIAFFLCATSLHQAFFFTPCRSL
ncbi:MAG TPA: hypothetical protein VGM52_01110 [Herbaspirillum sp.]|jgi:hypothetical protein